MKSPVILTILILIFASTGFSQNRQHPCAAVKSSGAQAKSNTLAPAQIARTELYDVGFYRLNLDMTNLSKVMSGTVTMQAKSRQAIDTVIFELHPNLSISKILLNGDSVGFIRKATAVYVPANLPAGLGFTIETKYAGTPPDASSNPFGDAGMSNASSPSWGNQITWTLSQPFSAYEWWPCKQSLRDKIDSLDVNITVPSACKAGSNGLLKNVVTGLPGGKSRYEWKHRHPIDYYLVSATVGKYVDYSFYAHPAGQDSILIQNYIYDNPQTLINFKLDIDETASFIELFSELFGPYPFRNEKYGHCMAPFGGGMEHQTMTSQGSFNADLTAHELAHQWFGDHVTCGSWADIWVNEGFATYSEYLMNERLYPAQAATVMNSEHTAAMQQANGAIWILDSLNSTRIFSSRLSYSKGAAFIHTLRYLVNNDSLFFNALREYQIRFADSTAIGTDVKKVLEDIGGVNLDEAFEQWYYGEGYPTYSLRWNTGNNNLYLKLSQTVSAPGVTPLFTTPLQIKFSRPGRPDTIIRFPITSTTEFILVPGISSISGTPVLDPSNYIINKSSTVLKDPTLVVTKNEALEIPKPDVVVLSTSEDGRFLLQSNGRESWEYAVLDTRGRLVGAGCLDQCQELNLSNCLSGVYLIRLVSASGNQVTHRLIRR